MIDALPLLLSDEGYQISRSVRLRSSASASFSRTPASTTNQKTFTFSGWVKRGLLATQYQLLSAGGTSNDLTYIGFNSSDQIDILNNIAGATVLRKITTAVYRDPSAWYHIVLATDTTNATAGNRVLLYVNGIQVTAFSTSTDPTLNQNTQFDSTAVHTIGRTSSVSSAFLDGYLTEINFIDGQALTPSSFGETNTTTGVWQPKKYAGTYGTNGFYLNFSDNSAATAAAIGKDYSGNGNNWTPNNISVTAGVTYDSMLDVPTQWADGGNGRGNYSVANPVNAASGLTVSDGNLKIAASAGGSKFVNSSIALPSSGAYYAEITCGNATTNLIGQSIGIQSAGRGLTSAQNAAGSYHFYGTNAGVLVSNATTTASGLSAISANEVFQVAIDVTNSKMWIGRSNVWYNSTGGTTGDPATGANPTFTAAFADLFIYSGFDTGSAVSANFNFGQRPFTYTPPSGFKALNTLNLPTPTILKGNQYFDVNLWTGDQSARTITNSGGFQPDFLWTKSRSFAEGHRLSDAVRGGNGTVLRTLSSNTTDAEAVDTDVTGFTSSGFNIRAGTNTPNVTGRTYVGWQWKEGATQGLDIVTYTGTGVANRTVAHNLGVTPAMIIVKARNSSTYSWNSWHRSLSSGFYISLNTTSAQDNSVSIFPAGGVTSTNWNTGGDPIYNNGSGVTYVAYVFAAVAGYSAFGSYTGNGSADGPFVFCGFRPAFVMIKRTDAVGNWNIYDTSRNDSNVANRLLLANTSDAEVAGGGVIDFISNGFKLRDTSANWNASGGTYVYACFASNPFKNALAR